MFRTTKEMKDVNPINETKDELTDFCKKNIARNFRVADKNIRVEIKGANFAKRKGDEILLDEYLVNERMNSVISAVTKSKSKYSELPSKVVIYNEDYDENLAFDKENNDIYGNKVTQGAIDKDVNGNNDNKDIDTSELVSVCEPKWTMDSVHLDSNDKETVLTALAMSKYKEKLFKEWGIKGNKGEGRAVCLNFWGPPGTGKSITAEAIASYLNKKLLIVNYSELESKYVGETPKNIKRVFKTAKEQDAVIVFDEADSFLGKRLTNVTQSADYGVNITRSVMLLELENFDGVVVFTTNLLTNYDDAFKRRILANIEFKLPDENGRRAIWKSHISSSMPIESNVNIDILANKFEKVSGADIKDIILFAAVATLRDGREAVALTDFEASYKIVRSRYDNQNAPNENVQIKTERISEEQYKRETEAK